MAELVDALEERTVTWPEKWKARYVAEGYAEGYAEGLAQGIEEGRAKLLPSLEKAVRARFGEVAAQAFGEQLEAACQTAAEQGPDIVDAIYQCVVLSENAEQVLAGLRSIRRQTA